MSSASGLIIEQTQQGSCHIVGIRGQLDHETLPSFTSVLDAAIADNQRTHIVIDLTEIGTLDSATLAVMLKAKQYANSLRRNLWFVVKHHSSPDRILSAANLLNHLGIVYEIDYLGPKPRPHPPGHFRPGVMR
jgi:anti-anti-sigma factor